jgi:hypothetical protein
MKNIWTNVYMFLHDMWEIHLAMHPVSARKSKGKGEGKAM